MKSLTRIAAGVGLATLAGAGLGRLLLRQPQPPLDGVVRPPGVRADVEIVRDRAGVPHIYAAVSRDLYYSLGFVHAQDRLFQMELNRRIAHGRLAEIFGEPALGFDRFMRRLGLAHVAAAEASALGTDERDALEGYADGVNGFLAVHRHRLPLEFRLLRARPEPWAPVDSLAWGKVMAWLLSANWDSEWFRARLVEQLGPESAAAFEPGYPAGHPITIEPGVSYAGLSDSLLAEFQQAQRELSLLAGGASNAWAVSGERSVTGMPLLASDPHLRPQMPAVWYEAHLCGDGLDVTGATMPALPAVLIGHNQQIAWGITASMVDTQDLFVEKLNPDNPEEYRTPNGWEPLTVRKETIRIRGRSEPVVELIQESRHGPSLTPLLNGERRFLAVACPLLQVGSAVRGAIRLNRAQGWDEFRAALTDWDVALNFVYADRAGNIGYQLSGRVPRRKEGTGLLPAPGWDERYDWAGYLTSDELPHVFNPPEGYVVSANNRLVGDSHPFFLSHDWIDGFRAMRIEGQLRARERCSLDDFAALQQDFYSDAARQIVEQVADLEPRSGDPLTTRALEHLRRWDFRMDPASIAATIYAVYRQRLLQNVFGSRLGALAGSYLGTAPSTGIAGSAYPARVTGFLIDVLRRKDAGWLAASSYRSWDDLLWLSLTEAVRELQGRLGEDMDTWRWGRLHLIRFDHPLGRVKPLDRLFCRGPYPIGGDSDTPHQSSGFSGDYAATDWIPSYRQLIDLGDFSKSRSIHTTGQSGLPGSPHFDDFIPKWRAGQYHPMLYDRIAILDDLEHMQVLRPQ
jgi:penicillin amidase